MDTSLIDYWRQSIADTQRLSPPISGTDVYEIEADCFRTGQIPQKIARKLIEKHRNDIRSKDTDVDIEKIKTAPVALTPFILLEKLEHTQARKRGQQSEAAVIWLIGNVNESGTLFCDPEFGPWIDRGSLEPVGTRSFVVGSVERVDAFLETNKLPESPNWEQIYSYATAFWKDVTSQDILTPSFENHAVGKGRITLFSEKKAAGIGLIELCDKLRDYELEAGTVEKTTLHTLLNDNPPTPKIASENLSTDQIKKHRGHIGKHTLARSQRQALTSILESERGDIIAVNGPPGTGKTTLVQSILASCVVDAAINGQKPFTMLACSTNNQAVTNLVDSLTEAATPIEGDLLSDRWLPNVTSLGLYFASQDARKRNANGKYLFAGLREHSFPDEIENTDFVDKAKKIFIEKARAYFGDDELTFRDICGKLHTQLKALSIELEASVENITTLTTLQAKLAESNFSSFELWQEDIKKSFAKAKDELALVNDEKANAQRGLDQAIQQARSLRRRVQSQMNAANLVELLLGFLPDIRQRKIYRAITALETAGFPEESAPLHKRSATLEDVDKVCEKIVTQANGAPLPEEIREKSEKAENLYNSLKNQIDNIEEAQQDWSGRWETLAEHLNTVITTTLTPNVSAFNAEDLQQKHAEKPEEIADFLDTLVRRRMFFLALRYWESRWLISAENITPEDRRKQGQQYVQERFERYAMLTPCFVATFHKAASAFRFYGMTPETDKKTPKLEERPLGGFFDMLVVDEAGQVSPEIGAPCFYLAKRATVVGDILQIPPVVTLNKFVDHGNLSEAGLLNQSRSLDESGYVSTTGNIMMMAQSRTSATLADVPGLFLSEHRRCFDEVIAYCNTFYKGKLAPMRGPSDGYLPPIGYAHIDGTAERISGSWTNTGEARAIANWVSENASRFEQRYGKPIHEIIAIVTPFRRQANLIVNELEAVKLTARSGKNNAITVGTVHSLQGAERPIVLFSSVYDKTVSSGYFFDSEHSMLNVAVSRAKDSFLVFGDMHIFQPASSSHSGQLAKFMFAREQNEISDVIAPQKLISKTNGKLNSITKLKEHREVLAEAFTTSKERLLIYSPFLSANALRDDNILQLIKDTTSRNVKIAIVTCEENIISSKKHIREAVDELQKSGVHFIQLSRIHNKTMAIDSRKIIEGSFNWLSASRDENYANQERSFSYEGEMVEELINTAWSELKERMEARQQNGTEK
ncbi:AAA domain-containing protein [Thalassospira sp. MA62]|nr:AAA domain-containing protein [Thalassospira sp. MA62]